MNKEKIEMLELSFCSAYKLYLQSMRDKQYEEERAVNLSRYLSMRRVLEIMEYSDADISQLQYEVERKFTYE